MSTAVIGVGTNLGAREAAIHAAVALIDARPAIEVSRVSPIYETAPLGPPQGRYLNAALRIETALELDDLLRVLLKTERRLGRVRTPSQRWGPRSVDLDLLWDSRGPYESDALRVPHPELAHRSFALGPCLDVAPELASEYQRLLERLGGRPPVYTRSATVRTKTTGGHVERDVEAESLADACALAASLPRALERPWSTRHLLLGAGAEHFANALRAAVQSGFSVHHATVSHCSKSQWVAQFHGANGRIPPEADVRLYATSTSGRRAHVTLQSPVRFG